MTLLIIIYLSFAGIGLQNSVLGAAWPSMYEGFGVPNSYLGIISIIILGFDFIASVYSGKLLKRFKTGPVVTACMLIIVISLIGFGLSGTFVSLCVFAVPLGLAIGFANVAVNNYVAINFKPKHMNWLHCVWGIGAAVSPLIVSYGLEIEDSWRWGYCMVAFVEFGFTLVMLKKISSWGKEVTESPKEASKIKFAELIRLRGIKASLTSFFCYCSIETVICLWGSSYLVIEKNVSEEMSARTISVFFLGITLGRLLSGVLTSKFNNVRLVRIGYVTIVLGICIALLSSGNIQQVAGFFLMGIGCSPIIPCLVYDTPVHFKKEYSPSVIGLQMAALSIGATVTPPLFGTIASRASYGLFPLFIGKRQMHMGKLAGKKFLMSTSPRLGSVLKREVKYS